MKIIKQKPTINSTRHYIKLEKSILSKNNNIGKTSIIKLKKTAGRCSITGQITNWHKGGGHKKIYRKISRENNFFKSILIAISYNPYNTAFTALNFNFKTKKFFRTIATNKVKSGALLECNIKTTELKLGFRTSIKQIPTGSLINNLSTTLTNKAQYIRSAGTTGQILQHNIKNCKIRLPSNKIYTVKNTAFAIIGVNSNIHSNLQVLGKAGRNRNLGKRPIVRGIAMNPVDHPHGGRTNGGKPSVTPWGLPTKCKFTLKKNKKNYE